MKHVCVDARLYQAAGIGTYLKSSLKAIKDSGRYHLSLLCNEVNKTSLQSLSSRLILMKSNIYSIGEQKELSKKIPRCDLFWAPHFNIPLFPILAKKRLTTISDVYHLAFFTHLPLLQKAYAKLFYNAAFFLSDTVITLSEFSKSEILKFAAIKPKKLHVLPPIIDFSNCAGSESKECFLLAVSSLKPHKNMVNLVKAYAMLKPKEALYIVGKKEGLITQDSELFQVVEKDPFLKKNIQFKGFVSEEELKKLYGSSKLFIFPSKYEGFGYPPLEAMANGCPVLASRAASIPEVCGEAVEYIDPYSVESIAKGIEGLLCQKERREALIQRGREHVQKLENRKNHLMDLIDACCGCT